MKKKESKGEINPTIVKIVKIVVYAIGLFFAGVGTEDTAVAMGIWPL